ncbi:MAG: AGCS family alanine or glycine:cation symporter [Sphingobacteriales bacterium]|jgi:AGCS family alanine or glycine:cation symporter
MNLLKRATGVLMMLFSSLPTWAQEASGGMDEKIDQVFRPIVDALGSVIFWQPFAYFGIPLPFVVIWLVAGATYFTVKMGFINFRGFKHAIELVRGVFDKPGDHGEVTHFQALVTALSATVGLGNIAGVAVAITLGGPGATFWIILAGIIGMSSKFVECTLGVKYRVIKENGEVSGGPMYYLSDGLEKLGKGGLGRVLAIVFAILCIGGSFGGGNMFQANQAFAQLSGVEEFSFLQGKGVWFGLIMAVFVGIVIIGGIKSIARVTDKIVPFMVGIYVLAALIIIFMNIENIGEAFGSIIGGAFNPGAAKGGIIGVLIIGFQRAAFSNEAGVGSASIAHAAAKTDEPVSEGIVAVLEPFVDTVLVCTMTALVLIFTGFADGASGLDGSQLTSAAFSSVIPWFKYILLVAIVLFAFSTMISWSYYGLKAWTFVFGDSKKQEYIYKGLFLVFTVIGASSSLGAVIDFSDMMILGMAFPNILGLYFLAPEVRKDLTSYLARVKSGVIKRYK